MYFSFPYIESIIVGLVIMDGHTHHDEINPDDFLR